MLRGLESFFLVCALAVAPASFGHAQLVRDIEDITGRYSFLQADDLLAILDEDGELRGYIDVHQTAEESDAIFSYTISHGTRKGNKVEFKTIRIHGLYYRFSGRVQRGKTERPDRRGYLQLIGTLQIVRRIPATGEEKAERRHVVFESLADE